MEALGRTRWAIAEGYIPSESSSSDRALISHETACILNATDRDADVAITIFFADRDPVGPYRLTVAARRTLHLRFNDLDDPRPNSARHGLCVGLRIRRADRRAAYPTRLAPRRARPLVDHWPTRRSDCAAGTSAMLRRGGNPEP
jgi:hypothetical protein